MAFKPDKNIAKALKQSNDIKNNESSYLDKVLNKEDPFDEVL